MTWGAQVTNGGIRKDTLVELHKPAKRVFPSALMADTDMQYGLTSKNNLVDVAKSFSDHVFEDLQAAAGSSSSCKWTQFDIFTPSVIR